jgi:hypothetical protein
MVALSTIYYTPVSLVDGIEIPGKSNPEGREKNLYLDERVRHPNVEVRSSYYKL